MITVVRIGFNQTTYAAPEEDDSGEGYEVEVCINRSGELERSVAVYLTTASGSATGNYRHWMCSCSRNTYTYTYISTSMHSLHM